MLALSVIDALRRFGRRVPEDIAVVGFDGIALGQVIRPRLATVAVPNRALGETAARLLLAAIDGTPPAMTVLPHQFRAGGTIAPSEATDPGVAPPGPAFAPQVPVNTT